MLSRTKCLLKFSIYQNVFRKCHSQSTDLENFLTSISSSPSKTKYSLLFFDEKVQNLLKKITSIDLERVFKPRPTGQKVTAPVYKLLTTEELQEQLQEADENAKYYLQIPPLIDVTEDKCEILDSDTSLDGFDEHHSKIVFTDTSFNETDESRVIVVREPNGILRTALKDERFRMNQIYNPLPGRNLEMPKMFEVENLVNIIKRKDYEFILDRACAQFEPHDQMYHNVITLTYEGINFCEDFEMLLSTRHFGSLAFYLITHQNIDNLLNFYILNDRIDNAFSLVSLYHIIHPECKSAQSSRNKEEIELLKDFIEFDSKNKVILKRNLDYLLRKEETEKDLKSGIKDAHGI